MSRIHTVKEWPETFPVTASADTSIQFRKNDRNYERGDFMDIREFDQVSGEFTGKRCIKYIEHVRASALLPKETVAMVVRAANVTESREVLARIDRIELTPIGESILSHMAPENTGSESMIFEGAKVTSAEAAIKGN